MKKILVLIFILSLVVASAHGEETFTQAEDLINQKISCDQLTEDQLEGIGDYYMEQMHPGEAHKTMDEMMGGEGSETLRQMHINMAKSFYCGEHGAMSSGMMNMIMGRNSMMNMMGGDNMAFGMMGDVSGMGMIGGSLFGLFWFALIAFVFSIIFWLTHNWLVKCKKTRRN